MGAFSTKIKMKHLKSVLVLLYVMVIIVMATATIIEKYKGTAYVGEYWYGSWWFSVLWALLAAAGITWFVKRRVRKVFAVVLHLSFIVILAGALLTHLTARQGMLHLRKGESTNSYLVQEGNNIKMHALPFRIVLKDFEVKYYEGTTAHADYVTKVTILPLSEHTGSRSVKGQESNATISMNKILSYQGFRFYQSSYDPDMQGSILAVNSDPWGIPVTYTGYALLFIALIWMLFDPKGQYRRILREINQATGNKRQGVGDNLKLQKSLVLLAFLSPLSSFLSPLNATNTISEETAGRLGELYINYNDRICPLQTYALDFTKKLTGKRYYKDAEGNRYTAEQLLANFIFYGDEWEKQPVIKMKSGLLKSTLQLPDHCSFSSFFKEEMGGYILGPYVQEAAQGNRDKFHQDVMKVDDKLIMLVELRQGMPLKIFPAPSANAHRQTSVTWYAPTDELPDNMDSARKKYIQDAFSLLYKYALDRQWDQMNQMLTKMQQYQQRYGAASLPTKTQTWAEHIYNKVPFATILFMVCLTMAFLTLIRKRWMQHIGLTVLGLSFLALTFTMALRWIISGTIPMANAYETMLTMAWFVMLISLLLYRRFPVILTFGLLLSGFFLLVSHISQMDPQIGHLMPVLSSPLLTIHVSVIMMAYALLSITFLTGIWGLITSHSLTSPKKRKNTSPRGGLEERGTLHSSLLMSQLFLYPALTCMGLGIFIGAIWANVSWGTYWSWDPKETWALITFMVYAVPVHQQSIPWLRNPRNFHLYMVLAFLTILMTYFGVNYFLGGMHSYA